MGVLPVPERVDPVARNESPSGQSLGVRRGGGVRVDRHLAGLAVDRDPILGEPLYGAWVRAELALVEDPFF